MEIRILGDTQDDSAKLSSAERLLKEVVSDAADKVLNDRATSLVAKIDVVTEGPTPQLTPLLTYEGVVIRLDLSDCFIPIYDLEPNRARIKTLAFHELFHLRDRLNPSFDMNYHQDSTRGHSKSRRYINGVWDVSIERRKLDEFKLPSFPTFTRPLPDSEESRKDSRDAMLWQLNANFPNNTDASSIFDDIWDTAKGKVNYPELLVFADRLKKAEPSEPE